MRLRRSRKRAAASALMLIAAAALVPMAAQAPAQAAPTVATGTTAWTPDISPMFDGEFVWRDVTSANRNEKLAICAAANGIACVSVGQGDGRHSIFHLFRCETRTLSNFIDALAVKNHQTGGVQIHFWGPHKEVWIKPDPNILWTVPDNYTYDFEHLDLC
ncbi:hypothetical protein [Kribbella ginsengisoli]|uniref:Secreted protein n=2 Tax=Kribbella TaxID=182639 RepID=A0ABP6W520_9ACTN